MFRFLKGLGRRGETPAALGIEDLPAWIPAEEERVRGGLADEVAARAPAVHRARDRMEEVLSGFDASAMQEVASTKLAGVTERSLPLFLKAMRTSLSRELPEDPERFYTAAAEILKGCLSAFRGQGRYLASRFPQEMKILRDGVDDIGKEVNALTPGFARARERFRDLAAIREALDAYRDAERRLTAARERIHTLEEEEAGSRASRKAAGGALADLEGNEEYRAWEAEASRVRGLEEERDEAERRFRAVAAAAIHLLRKGEKIATRKGDRGAIRALHEAVSLLEAGLPVPEDAARRVMPPAQDALAAMAASGELTPKNREETDLMETPGGVMQALTGLSGRFIAISAGVSSAQEALRARPVFGKRAALTREAEDLERRIDRTEDLLRQAGRDAEELEGKMHALLDDIRQRVEALSGRPFRAGEGADRGAEAERDEPGGD